MRLRYGFLCDYAASGAGNKPTVVGIFDGLVRAVDAPPAAAPHYVFVSLACSAVEGPRHLVGFRLLNADARELARFELPADFSVIAPGQELTANATLNVVGLGLSDFGDYVWEVTVDGARIGEIPFTLYDAAAIAAAG